MIDINVFNKKADQNVMRAKETVRVRRCIKETRLNHIIDMVLKEDEMRQYALKILNSLKEEG